MAVGTVYVPPTPSPNMVFELAPKAKMRVSGKGSIRRSAHVCERMIAAMNGVMRDVFKPEGMSEVKIRRRDFNVQLTDLGSHSRTRS